jgi:hypothetical protein
MGKKMGITVGLTVKSVKIQIILKRTVCLSLLLLEDKSPALGRSHKMFCAHTIA